MEDSVQTVDYSDRSFAVFGDTKPIKEELKQLGGRFNKYLKHDGVTKAGWIFPMKDRDDVEQLIKLGKSTSEAGQVLHLPGLSKVSSGNMNPSASSDHGHTHNPLTIENHDGVVESKPFTADYSDRSFAVFGDTKPIKEELKALGGRFNKYLKHDGVTKAGWIFPMKDKAEVEELIGKSTVTHAAVDKKRKADSL